MKQLNAYKYVSGCLVSQSKNKNMLGVVRNFVVRDGGNFLIVDWIAPIKKREIVAACELKSGFQSGMTVVDCTPLFGFQSLGQGVIMQQRVLAGVEQALVEFQESGSRCWLPYQHLRFVKDVKQLFVTGYAESSNDAERMRLRMLAHAIEIWNENTGALSHLDIDPLPHQINLVHRILSEGNYSWLIADDVGLGKTIETGMLLHALRQRGLAKRILLVTPAGLTKQWQEELYHKFKIEDFEIYNEDFFINEFRQWKMHDCVIGSIDRLKQEAHLNSLIEAEPWDLVIFDEGHRLSRRQYGQKFESSDRYEFAKKLRKKTSHMLILSATPHQGMQDKFVGLLELLRPDRRDDLMTLNLNPEILHDMVFRNHKADVTDAEGNFIFQGKITRVLRVPSSIESIDFDRDLQSYLKMGYEASAALGQKGNAIGFVMTVYRKLAASSSAAIYKALCARKERIFKNSVVEIIDVENGDYRYYGELEELFLGSVREFFEGEVGLLDRLIDRAGELKRNDKKLDIFINDVLKKIHKANPYEKILVFTEYRATQEYLRDVLSKKFGNNKVDVINGSMNHKERSIAINNFENNGLILISTEAGGEGINLQSHCHIMVNYDLPWNPMRLVQRIGRLYRYGQKKKVVVFNIQQEDSLDQSIVDLMYERIDSVITDLSGVQENEFNDGLRDEILGQIAEVVDVEDVLHQSTMLGIDRTAERIDQALKSASDAISKQRELFAYAASSNSNGDNNFSITQDHLYSFVEGMFDQLEISVLDRSFEGKVLSIRLPVEIMKEIGFIYNHSGRIDVTFDRLLASQKIGIHMLDINSSIFRYLIKKAKDYDFGGLVSSVNSNVLGDGALFGCVLRWQGPQGRRMRQEFISVLINDDGLEINSPRVDQWILECPRSTKLSVDRQVSSGLIERVEASISLRLKSLTNTYMMPESVELSNAAWTVNDL